MVEASASDSTYEGIKSLRWKYGGKTIPGDAIQMGPYQFKKIRDITNRLWNEDDCNIFPLHYEGLCVDGLRRKYVATEFLVGWNFQKQSFAYQNGIDLSIDDLQLEIMFNDNGSAKYIDFFLVYGVEITIKDRRADPPKY
jgi:hypothetical protein